MGGKGNGHLSVFCAPYVNPLWCFGNISWRALRQAFRSSDANDTRRDRFLTGFIRRPQFLRVAPVPAGTKDHAIRHRHRDSDVKCHFRRLVERVRTEITERGEDTENCA